MDNDIEALVQRLVKLEDELERKLEAQRDRFRYRLDRGRAVFEDGVERRHRAIRIGLLSFLRHSPLASLIVAPAVYGLIVPLVLLDLSVTVYQVVCFSAWGIKRVPRREYVVLDRHRLAYLNGIQKLNCVYCGYANGVIAYTRETASRTEQFWCPIKHALKVRGSHPRYRRFVDYGDAEGFRDRLEAMRQEVRSRGKDGATS